MDSFPAGSAEDSSVTINPPGDSWFRLATRAACAAVVAVIARWSHWLPIFRQPGVLSSLVVQADGDLDCL